MNYQDAKETLLLISQGYDHNDGLRNEAIRVVLAEVERLKRMEESHREQGLVPSEWLTRAEAAEARVKELEAELRRHVADSVVVVQQVERLRAALREARGFLPAIDTLIYHLSPALREMLSRVDAALSQPEAAPCGIEGCYIHDPHSHGSASR